MHVVLKSQLHNSHPPATVYQVHSLHPSGDGQVLAVLISTETGELECIAVQQLQQVHLQPPAPKPEAPKPIPLPSAVIQPATVSSGNTLTFPVKK